jgi:ubiquinone/menaquinone biosynthesis C-methylase UbiE
MFQVAALFMNRFPDFRRWANRIFYQFLAWIDREGEVTLMNYGYISLEPDAATIPLEASDEGNRLCLQLYHHIASAVELKDRDMLEVGSGRGGGAAYVRRAFKLRSMTGVDYSERAVAFCQRAHQQPGLQYVHGDAEALPFEDQRFDAVLNVESSHCYGSMQRFLSEVHRVLKTGGRLSWADFRSPEEIAGLEEVMRACGFEIEKAAHITDNVLAAMAAQGEHYRALIDRKVPRFARRLFYHFAGVEGSMVLDKLRSGELVYLHRVLVKAG